MADLHRDVDQAITALKKGAYLLKYGRRGKPKFCPFRLSTDESALIWDYGKEEKKLELRKVSKLIPGQRTSTFQRYPRPEKEYQSFSLIYSDGSLDLICKDKDEAEIWILGLKALLARNSSRKDEGDTRQTECTHQSSLGKAFADILAYTATLRCISQGELHSYSMTPASSASADNPNGQSSTSNFQISLSSAVSSSSHDSCHEDFDSLGDVFLWGEGAGDGLLGGGVLGTCTPGTKRDAHLPKLLESSMVLDAYGLACGSRHAALVTKQGEIFSWGEESGGRLGQGIEADVPHPKIINTLSGMNIEMVACGEYHTCAVTLSGDLYTWGDGTYSSGLLGHGNEVSHCIPKKVGDLMDGIHVSYVSCGTWHTALIASAGQLFTFGDGTFGGLGHGDRSSTSIPKEVDILKGKRTLMVACGVWHTAAVVEVTLESSYEEKSDGSSLGQLFTWGDGDKGRLGHGDKESRLIPGCVAALADISFSKVACGWNLTIALTTSGQIYTIGSTDHGQLGSSEANGKVPTSLKGKFGDSKVEEIACGSHHVAVLTSKSVVYTWGKGAHGQLGHGDKVDRDTPLLVDFLKERQVTRVVCGENLTAVICLHKWVSGVDNSMCFSCHTPFNFIRKRHNCYNCGLVFCNACSSKKSLKASLAPSTDKPYRVCDDCHTKLQRTIEGGSVARVSTIRSGNVLYKPIEFALAEKDIGASQFQGQASRLSLGDSEGRISLSSPKVDVSDYQMFNELDGHARKGSLSVTKTISSLSSSPKKKFPVSLPSSRTQSRPTSPCSRKGSSPLFTISTSSRSGHTYETLSHEVINLRAQVEELASKSLYLESQLEKKSMQLKEATALATDEAEKSKAAKDVINCLTAKLKDMTERVPEGLSHR